MKYWSPTVPDGYKADCIFNELYIDWSQPIVLVEGFFDAMKAKNAIPLFGSFLNERYSVFQKIIRNNVPVYLALDADANKKAYEIGDLFMSYDADVYFVDVSPFKDIGEMTKEQFLKKMDDAVPFSKEFIFRNKLRMLCR